MREQTLVTDDMLAAAMKKAVSTGLVPSEVDGETYLTTWDSMKQCIAAALAAAPVQEATL